MGSKAQVFCMHDERADIEHTVTTLEPVAAMVLA